MPISVLLDRDVRDNEDMTSSGITRNGDASDERIYDIAISFAGEDRQYAYELVTKWQTAGYVVFYDEDNPESLVGEELTEFFQNVYEKRARYAVMVISEAYARKPWTTHERRSILSRALSDSVDNNRVYLLPIRLDDTNLPGLRSTTGYLDARAYSVSEIAEIIEKKIGKPNTGDTTPSIQRTPETAKECQVLLSERPENWEFYYTAYLLMEEMNNASERIFDARHHLYSPGEFVPDSKVAAQTAEDVQRMRYIAGVFGRLLDPVITDNAWGQPGTPGDPESIRHFASRYGNLLKIVLDWSERVGSYVTESDEAGHVFSVLSRYNDQPIQALVSFARTFKDEINDLPSKLEAAPDNFVSLTFTQIWNIPQELSNSLEGALSIFSNRA